MNRIMSATEWTTDSARGSDGSIGVVIDGPDFMAYVDVLVDGRARVYVRKGMPGRDVLIETVLPSPPMIEDES